MIKLAPTALGLLQVALPSSLPPGLFYDSRSLTPSLLCLCVAPPRRVMAGPTAVPQARPREKAEPAAALRPRRQAPEVFSKTTATEAAQPPFKTHLDSPKESSPPPQRIPTLLSQAKLSPVKPGGTTVPRFVERALDNKLQWNVELFLSRGKAPCAAKVARADCKSSGSEFRRLNYPGQSPFSPPECCSPCSLQDCPGGAVLTTLLSFDS